MGSLHGCLPLHITRNSSGRWHRFLRRCCHPSQLDVQYSVVQCKLLLSNPSRLYSLASLRQKEQQSCAREDPAFLLLLLLLLLVTGIGHAAALQAAGAGTFVAVALVPVSAFAASSLVVVPVAFFSFTRGSTTNNSGGYTTGRLASNSSPPFDLAFSFDLHCNGSFVYAVYTQVVPLVLQPVLLLLPLALRRWLAASMHCYGLWGYAYVSALGYLAVGRLRSAAPLLLLSIGLIVAVICCAASGVDFLYFPSRMVQLGISDIPPEEHAAAVGSLPAELPLQ